MQDIIQGLEGRRDEIRNYLKTVEAERADMIKRSDELSGNLRNAENDLARIERALMALAGDDMQLMALAGDDMQTVRNKEGTVPREAVKRVDVPYHPGS
jgi:uncharacterized coiled-coil DUF342 family protein